MMKTEEWGQTANGEKIFLFTLRNKQGYETRIANYGATIIEFHAPDRHGELRDITSGFATAAEYLNNQPFFGVIAGRYANRIAHGKFKLHGTEYQLATNNGPNHLHGGINGIDKKLWTAQPVHNDLGPALQLRYRSPDLEEGYPGNLDIVLTYLLTEDNELHIDYEARCDKPTPINLTNHAYWNLEGEDSGNVYEHVLTLNADHYTPVDENLIPTGEIRSVADSAMDYRKAKPIGQDIHNVGNTPIGYDHNFVLNQESPGKLTYAARVKGPKSGRVMEVYTTEPALQFYTANFLDGTIKGKGGVLYQQHGAFCLECQHYPDSPNQADFPSTVLEPGGVYRQTTIHRFYTE